MTPSSYGLRQVGLSVFFCFTSIGTLTNSWATVEPKDLFEFEYNSQNQLEKVWIAKKSSLDMSMSQNSFEDLGFNFLSRSLRSEEAIEEIKKWPSFKKLNHQEKTALIEALQINTEQKYNNTFDIYIFNELVKDSWLKIWSQRYLYLLADLSNKKTFDQDKIIVESIKASLDLAQDLLGNTPLFTVFEFLVTETLESVQSRREFYQNALLVYLNSHKILLEKESQNLKSSIFYSRLSLTDLKTRNSALQNWSHFGVEAEKKYLANCKKSSKTFLQNCYEVIGDKVINLSQKQFRGSQKPALALHLKRVKEIKELRTFILALKLSVKLSPAPGPVKSVLQSWLNSHYRPQRRSEGLLYLKALESGEHGLAQQLLKNQTLMPLP